MTSPNFAYLERKDPLLYRYAVLAERYFAEDPNGCVVKMRQFAEALAHATAAGFGKPASTEDEFVEVLRGMDYRVPERIVDLLHEVRKLGNRAVHAHLDEHRVALTALRIGHQLAGWYYATFRQKGFRAEPFATPPNPADATKALVAELQQLRAEAAAKTQEVLVLRDIAAEREPFRQDAEARIARAYDDLQAALELAAETERRLHDDRARYEAELAALRASVAPATPAAIDQVVESAEAAAEIVDLDEATTRRLIDDQLVRAGWEADTQTLRWSNGTRPQKGRFLAIAEVPTASGPVDYVLYLGLRPVAVVEAKRTATDVPGVLGQAQRSARDLPADPAGVWGDFKVPFAFATNGRPYLAQLHTKSGIWFRDLREDTNHGRALAGWFTPEGLEALLDLEPQVATDKLVAEPFDDLHLYDYQIDVIRKVEAAIAQGQRSLLVAMATGTGKTRTALGLIYRALKAKRFRRVLFLVDRTSLGDQTLEVVEHMAVDGHQTIDAIYDVKGLDTAVPDGDTRLHLTTVQGLVRRVLYSDDPPPVDQYDLIVVDECHRGYTLDREMSDGELTFRSEADFVSKYRRVLDWFDAVKVGLTATPAIHTTQIFGRPVATYSYRQAVIDGRLIDHEPPFCIVTAHNEDGVTWKKAESVKRLHVRTGQIDTVAMPDEVSVGVDDFNTRVLDPPFNDVVCTELAEHLDPNAAGKTLIFCVRDDHADMVVATLKEKLAARWGPIPDSHVHKITGRVDDPGRAIRLYKNEANPKIAVTVDLLTTGIDVPAIVNLVFLRRVRSRILYEQMLGRATRRCDKIGKEVFRIYDCVNLYEALEEFSTMRPVSPKGGSFTRLIEDLGRVRDDVIRRDLLDQVLARLHRKRPLLVGDLLDRFVAITKVEPTAIPAHLGALSLDDAAAWLTAKLPAFELLDEAKPPSDPTMLIVEKPDTLRPTQRGYGKARRPEDYLDGFRAFLEANRNRIPALTVVLQRPRELTRSQLKELLLALDEAGYSEVNLRTAWREMTNEDIGATVVGHIRRAALGSPLVPYEVRVDRALEKLLARRTWTKPQADWLRRFANQLKVETVLDREALDRGQFRAEGGFARINRAFEGNVDDAIGELTDALWADYG